MRNYANDHFPLSTNVLGTINVRTRETITLGAQIKLAKGRVHEVMGNGAEMFAILATSQATGPILWMGQQQDIASLAPTGLQDYIDPARLILVAGTSRQEVLWAADQALRLKRDGCVVIELKDGPDLRESRRLQIAAEQSGSLGLVLINGQASTSAAHTRWVCEAVSDQLNCWHWQQIKNRQGDLSAWRVKWVGKKNAPGVIHMVSALAA